MKLDAQRIVIGVAALAAVALLIWALQTPKPGDDAGQNGADVSQPSGGDGGNNVVVNGGDNHTEHNGGPITPTNGDHIVPGSDEEFFMVDPLTTVSLPADQRAATAEFQRGLELLSSRRDTDRIAARGMISAALLSGHLSPADAQRARQEATALAEETILSGRVFEGDDYCYLYTVKSGDTLTRIENQKERLHVPTQLIEHVNAIFDPARDLKAFDDIKLVRGPFHAVVDRQTLKMDVYGLRRGLAPVYVCRLDVGLGSDGNETPAGLWRIKLGSKLPFAAWYPPRGSGLPAKIEYGEPNYAFGQLGLWMRLEPIGNGAPRRGNYGIHSTSDQSSIGRRESSGCIRLRDADITLVYAMLYEKWSTVLVLP